MQTPSDQFDLFASSATSLDLPDSHPTRIETRARRIRSLRQATCRPDARAKRFQILLAAPNRKAAIACWIQFAMHTALMPSEANTIHKLLGYQHGKVNFKHNRNNPLNADVVLVDEASMIDIALMSKLVEAVPAHAKLILIGDKDQLSSVETGSVFADMCVV
ncbi:RecBCD enzyme subunit RecD [Nymphon striatum]|nr:RecBCD enzyme subunit RecD [Nymphon striatum]